MNIASDRVIHMQYIDIGQDNKHNVYVGGNGRMVIFGLKAMNIEMEKSASHPSNQIDQDDANGMLLLTDMLLLWLRRADRRS